MNKLCIAAALAAASLSVAAQDMRPILMGSSVPASPAQRSIVVNADTRWVNVTRGEVVRFVSGNAEFAWQFDGRSVKSFDLQEIAPAGVLTKPVTVYVSGSGGHP